MDKRRISVFILAALLAVATYLAPIQLDMGAKIVLAIMVLGMVLWVSETIPLHATAIIVVFLLVVVAGISPKDAFTPFFDPVVVLLLGGFVLARALTKHNLDEFIAMKFLDKFGSSPRMFLLGMMYITAFLSMWISNTASTAVLLPIAIVVLSENGLKALKSNYGKSMVLGIAFAATTGGVGTLLGSTPNLIAAKFLTESGIQFGFNEWLFYGLPVAIIFIPIAWFALTTIFRPEIQSLKRKKYDKKLTGEQKLVLLVFAITVCMWLSKPLHGIANSTVALIPIILLYLMNLLDSKDFSKVNWGALILIGGGLSLGLSIQATGLDIAIADLMKVLIQGQPILFMFIIIATFGIILTTFASNTAAAAVMIPIMIPLAEMLNIDPRIPVLIIAITVSMDYLLPVGTPPSAIAYSSGYVRVKDMLKGGFLLTVSAILLVSVIAFLIW